MLLLLSSSVIALVEYLIETPLYRHHKIRVDPGTLDAIPDAEPINEDEIEATAEVADPDDPVQCVSAMHAVIHTVVFDDAAVDSILLVGGTHYLAIAPGEGQVPVSLLYDEHAEELFPRIYFGHPRKITSPQATPFSKATSEIRRSHRRGVEPAHILYMAMKVIRFNFVEKAVTSRTNDVTRAPSLDNN
ncbi:hypothetical protein HPB50_019232 [Hyalomma asiaticum]|uniref:Uncharacterized protein n=1 Tax=Hyalomma asiaticum TaxID=266040 RepID=A0ACB7S7M8_HYAAI|nr:hypothetical protein HPB50_019232 [Hyalomma asiaticum]